ncbi:sigma-70 family RNA polymerase sigma factor [Dactylosporangium sp. NPDC048998]|uniref:sigma-70 family RNA polymerase sigma factor n=1 Tax=Dactylosporangium sp. NPDC048998 TaxID=3363976 RepID=UPI00371BB199
MVVVPGGSGRQPAHMAEDKLARLHASFREPLTGYVTGLLFGDRPTAEDIVQETFTRAWRHLSQHDVTDVAVLRPWLYTVARHLVIDTLRARRVRPSEVTMDKLGPVASTNDDVARMVETDRMHRALLKLSPDHRTVLIELYFHDRSFEEIAQRHGIPVGTVRSRSHYAKRALRAVLDEQPG